MAYDSSLAASVAAFAATTIKEVHGSFALMSSTYGAYKDILSNTNDFYLRGFMRKLVIGALGIIVFAGGPSHATETINYTYDAQGRLTQVTHSGSVYSSAQSTYQFDNANNRTLVTVTNASSRVVVVPINGLTVIPIPDP